MENKLEKLYEIYDEINNIQYSMGVLSRSAEKSADFTPLKVEHFYEIRGLADALGLCLGNISDRLIDIIESMDKI